MKTQEIISKETEEENQLMCQLIDIELVDFEIHSKRDIQNSNLNFQIDISHFINKDGTVKVDAKVSILDNAEVLSSINLVCAYEIEEYPQLLESNKLPKGKLPPKLAIQINQITISTLRGVMFSKLQNTFLKSTILPIIDLSVLQVQQTIVNS